MLSNLTINFYIHSEISKDSIDKIINLKQQHWPYSYESQLEWIGKSLNVDDYHILISDFNGNLMSYANLVKRIVNDMPILGIGNVCVNKEVLESGLGTFLMNVCKFYSKQLSLDLVLLCRTELVPFYEKCGFYKYCNKVYIDGKTFDNIIMFSNNYYKTLPEVNINYSF